MSRMPRIEFQIDTLALDALSPREGALFTTAFQDELTRLLLTEGLPAAVADAAAGSAAFPVSLDGGAIEAPDGLTPETLGVRVAGAVFRGLGGSTP